MMKKIIIVSMMFFVATQSYGVQLEPMVFSDFDEYVFAISWQPSFCQLVNDQYKKGERLEENVPDECKSPIEKFDPANHLTIHGLWPSLPASFKEVMQPQTKEEEYDRTWQNFGCATLPFRHALPLAENKCAANDLTLSGELSEKLREAMPGSVSSCLHEYEYAKHGVCFKFNQEAYFAAMMNLLNQVRNSKVGALLRENYGKYIAVAELLSALNESFGSAAATSATIACDGPQNQKNLSEIRLHIQKSKVNEPLAFNSFVNKKTNDKYCNNERVFIDTAPF